MSNSTNCSEKERIKALFLKAAEQEAEGIAERLAVSASEDLLGKTEFALRDAILRVGAKTLEGATNERAKKGGPGQQHRVRLRRSHPLCELAFEAGDEFTGPDSAGLPLLSLPAL